VMAAQGRGLRAGTDTAWGRDAMIQHRARHKGKARDLLYQMRLGRAAGVLRCRVPS
jgi:hypothetical protein